MTVEKIVFTQTFNTGDFTNQKLSVEIQINDYDYKTPEQDGTTTLHTHDEVVGKAFFEAKRMINDSFHSMNPFNIQPTHLFIPDGDKITVKYVPQNPIEGIIQDINNCTSIDEVNGLGVQIGLVAYKDVSDTNHELREAYNNKFIQLSLNNKP